MDRKCCSNNPFHQSEELISFLQSRKEYLLRIEKQLTRAIDKAPPGSLRINRNKGHVEYYQRETGGKANGLYLSKKNRKLAMRLGQKRYDQIARRSARDELALIDRFLTAYPELPLEMIASSLSPELRALILPIEEDDGSFALRWQNVPCPENELWEDTRRYTTARGEKVRSKSELIIANELSRAGVPYRYEYPVELKYLGTVHPDFTVLNVRLRKELLWEHRGMMDDPAYAENAVRKMAAYAANGYLPGRDMIITEETNSFPLDTELVQMLIQTFCK